MTAVAEMADAIEASFGIELGSIGRVDVSPNMYEYQKDGGRWHSMNTGSTEVPGRDLQWVSTVSNRQFILLLLQHIPSAQVARDIVAAARFLKADAVQLVPMGAVAINNFARLMVAVDAAFAAES